MVPTRSSVLIADVYDVLRMVLGLPYRNLPQPCHIMTMANRFGVYHHLLLINALAAVIVCPFSFHNAHLTTIKRQQPDGRSSSKHSSRAHEATAINQYCDHPNDDDSPLLIPITNPNLQHNATSLSNISISQVLRGIDALYPPIELSKRNAHSRTDGYWKYVARGEEPPMEFTYGEFDVVFFATLLDMAWEHYRSGNQEESTTSSTIPWKDKVFCDIGSGTGRLVLGAASLHPHWKMCRGIEILETIHNVSLQVLDECCKQLIIVDDDDDAVMPPKTNRSSIQKVKYALPIPNNITANQTNNEETIISDSIPDNLNLAPIQFTCGSFTDPYQYMGDIDCAFIFSSCMKPPLLKELSIAIGRQFRPGSIIITTEFPLVLRGQINALNGDDSMPHGEYEIELLERVDGYCWLMGGESTAYIHRVKQSLWKEYGDGPRTRPQMSLEDEAYQLVQLMESGKLTDVKAFWRDVHNELTFRGIASVESLSYEELIIALLSISD